MKMRARPHLHYAPVPGGVYFSGARAQFVMRGWELLYQVVDVCVPLLEDGTTEDELVAVLGTERARPVVRHLTTGLRDHGMLLDLERLTVAEPPDDVRARHAESIAYLESVCADPYAVFARLRAAKVLLYGPREAVRPAARGLTRAGFGRVVVPATLDDADAHDDVDAVLCCCGWGAGDDESFVVRVSERLGGAPVVPVLLGDQVLLAGPVIRERAGYPTWSAARRRAVGWARAERLEPSARPVADALVGALAGQLLFDVLAGVAVDGAAYVVHGAELVADRVVVGAAGRPDDRWHPLDDAEPAPMPEPDAAVDLTATVSARWTGLFTPVGAEEDLPQLPLALREIEYRANRSGSVVAWAPDQESVTVAVALEALRRSCTGTGVGAAGLTEEHWLIDGALRLLVDDARPVEVVAAEERGPEAFRIWQSLQWWGTGPFTVRLLLVPGIDWRLGRVESADTGEIVGQAWGADADQAVRDALGTALAKVQVRRARDDEPGVTELCTASLVSAGDSTIAELRKQVSGWAANEGVCYRGHSRRVDPVLGEIPLWFGPVEAGSLAQELKNAR